MNDKSQSFWQMMACQAGVLIWRLKKGLVWWVSRQNRPTLLGQLKQWSLMSLVFVTASFRKTLMNQLITTRNLLLCKKVFFGGLFRNLKIRRHFKHAVSVVQLQHPVLIGYLFTPVALPRDLNWEWFTGNTLADPNLEQLTDIRKITNKFRKLSNELENSQTLPGRRHFQCQAVMFQCIFTFSNAESSWRCGGVVGDRVSYSIARDRMFLFYWIFHDHSDLDYYD